jgi:type 2A phosphatase activator TIP41
MTARPPRGGIHHVSTDSYTHSGWSIVSSRAPIIGDQQITEYCEVLGKVLTLPEILFGNNKLVLRHNKSGYELSFSALHALQGWKAEDLAPLKVQVASEWQAARQQEIAAQSAIILQYDWTYTTPYQGTLGHATSPSPPAAAAAAADAGTGTASTTRLDFALGNADLQRVMPATARPPAAAEGAENRHPNSCPAPPPTTCTPATPAAAAAPGGGALPTWQPTSRQIDRGMLMCTDEPILFYAEVPLYESELDDNGACSCVVKVGRLDRGSKGGWRGGGGTWVCEGCGTREGGVYVCVRAVCGCGCYKAPCL